MIGRRLETTDGPFAPGWNPLHFDDIFSHSQCEKADQRYYDNFPHFTDRSK